MTLFARLGGRDGIEHIVDGLYDRLHADRELRRLFRSKRHGERARQKLFFEELFGGEALYTAAGHGDSGMQRRHAHRAITGADADRWLGHLEEAMEASGVASEARREVLDLLGPVADRLRNPGAPRSAFETALRIRTGDALEEALDEHPAMLNQRSGDGVTLLWAASRGGRLPLVELLVSRGANLDTPGSLTHVVSVMVSPLCIAMRMRHDDVAAFLLSRGPVYDAFSAAYLGDLSHLATTDLVDATSAEEDLYPVTPLHHAVDGGQPAAATLLIERGAQVAPYSRRLVALACRAESAELVRLLLEHGADARRAETLGPIRRGDAGIAKLLVDAGLDLDRRIRGRETFLTMACRGDKGGSPDAVRVLLDLGADPGVANAAGRTPLEIATDAGFDEIVRLLSARR